MKFEIADQNNSSQQETVDHKRRETVRLKIAEKEADTQKPGNCSADEAHTQGAPMHGHHAFRRMQDGIDEAQSFQDTRSYNDRSRKQK